MHLKRKTRLRNDHTKLSISWEKKRTYFLYTDFATYSIKVRNKRNAEKLIPMHRV